MIVSFSNDLKKIKAFVFDFRRRFRKHYRTRYAANTCSLERIVKDFGSLRNRQRHKP